MVLPLDTKVGIFRFNKSSTRPLRLRGMLGYLHRFHLPASTSVTVTTGKPGSFRRQHTNQPPQRMTKCIDLVQDSTELCQGRDVFTLWVIWTAVLLCNCVSCQWPDCFPEWPHSDEWMTVCFMIPFVLTLHVPSLSNCAFLFALVFLFLFFQAWSRMAMQVYGLKFKTLYCLPEGSGLGKQNNKFSWSLRLLGNFCSKWGQLGLK